MPKQIRQWNKPHAERRHARQQARQSAQHSARLESMVEQIVAALGRSRNDGVAFACDYEMVLLILALEINHGPGARSAAQHEQQRRSLMRGDSDPRVGRQKLTQGDNQRLIDEAVKLAIDTGAICQHIEPAMVALYLPTSSKTALKWTAFLNDVGRVDNYIPTVREQATMIMIEDSQSDIMDRLSGRERALLKKWGEQFPA